MFVYKKGYCFVNFTYLLVFLQALKIDTHIKVLSDNCILWINDCVT